MGTEMGLVQQKATSLRSFLFEDARKEAFASALPKWLSVDRLLRVVFSSAIRNPQILDCTRESILQAVMTCASLGIEPILGRGYLIPYRNNKLVAGKWEKVLECQFQPGYQGLVDLARRTDTISDVYGLNVFENDEFDLIYGTHRDIHHRPWFMDPKKKKDGPGDILGAYVVWLLKDGTQHPEFMHITDIHKRRDGAQAWQYAQNHKDDKHAQSTPWIQWPEEMNLKTVVKHSSKLIPASIEFMAAVQLDNDLETHGKQMGALFTDRTLDVGALGEGGEGDVEAKFLDLTAEVEPELVNQFVAGLVAHYKGQFTDQEIKAKALDASEEFMEKLKLWVASKAGPKTLKDEIGRLKTTGLKQWETEHHLALMQCRAGEYGVITQTDFEFFLDKWKTVIGHDYTQPGQPGEKREPTDAEKAAGQDMARGPEGKQPDLFFADGSKLEGDAGKAKADFLAEIQRYEETMPAPVFHRVLMTRGAGVLDKVDPARYQEILGALKQAQEEELARKG